MIFNNPSNGLFRVFPFEGLFCVMQNHFLSIILDGVNQALETGNRFLEPFGLSVELGDCDPEYAPFGGVLGSYEAGSIFEGVIKVNVFAETLLRTYLEDCADHGESPDESNLLEEAAVTVLHEVGHGLMERIVDYAENVDEISSWVDSDEAAPFFDVFNDDNKKEEDIVEEFGRNLFHDLPSPLSECIHAMHRKEFI